MPIIKRQDMNKTEGSSPGLEECEIADAAQGTNFLKIGEVTIAPNTRLPRHIHTNTEEAILILEGTLDVLLGSERKTLGPGHNSSPARDHPRICQPLRCACPAIVHFPNSRSRPSTVQRGGHHVGVLIGEGIDRLQFSP